MRKVRPVQRAREAVLIILAAALTVTLAIYNTWRAERDELVAQFDGRNMVRFNLKQHDGEANWTPRDLDDLQSLPFVSEVAWRGGVTVLTISGVSQIVYGDVSPGYVSFYRVPFVAGRDLDQDDANTNRIIISEKLAADLFPGEPYDAVLNRTVNIGRSPHVIVGVYQGSGPAYRARLEPELSLYGTFTVDDVAIRLISSGNRSSYIAELNRWLSARENLSMLEALLYEDVAKTNLRALRTPFIGELTVLRRILLGVSILFGIATAIGQSFLASLERSDEIALRRAFGSTMLRTIRKQIIQETVRGIPFIAIGVVLGLLISRSVGSVPGVYSALLSAFAVWLCNIIGSLLAVYPVLRKSLSHIFMSGEAGLLRSVGNPVGTVGIIILTCALTVAGGFAVAGEQQLNTALQAIGATRVQLVSSGSTTRPPAMLSREDLAAIRENFPEFDALYLVWLPAEYTSERNSIDGTVYFVDGDYETVSGTTLEMGSFTEGMPSGVILGRRLAEELFEDRQIIGEQLTIRVMDIPITAQVTGVAKRPLIDHSLSLQLKEDSAVLSIDALPFVSFPRIYLDVGNADSTRINELVEFMNARHPHAASFFVRYPSEAVRSLQDYFHTEQYYLKALVVMVGILAAIASAAFLYADAIAHRRVYALRRALGASQVYLRRVLILGRIGRVVATGLVGVVAGHVILFLLMFNGYDLVLPFWWVAVGMAYALALGLVLGLNQVRWIATNTPMGLLRGER